MPALSLAQRRAGRELGSASAVADSKQTMLCTYLSAVLLVGLIVNSLFGWWWADPIAAMIIAALAVREGREAWKGDNCCAAVGLTLTKERSENDDCDDGCCTPTTTTTTGLTIGKAPGASAAGDGDCCGPKGASVSVGIQRSSASTVRVGANRLQPNRSGWA